MAANSGKLHLAAQSGDHAGMDAALKSGNDVNQPDGHGKTPLSYAAALPDIAVAGYLLDKGADPNFVAGDGDTALLVASRKANLPVVELLVRRGARIDTFGEDGFTSLAIAATGDDKELFDQLLKLGAKPNASLANCDTALIKSIPHKDPYFFDRLMAAGADPNLKGRAGNTPLIFATFADKPEIVAKLLSAGARVDDVNDAGHGALLFAAGVKGIDPDIAQLLVRKGADVNKTARDGLTPVKVACEAGRADLVLHLYEKGAKTDFEDSSEEGLELNGTTQHVLGDYFLAQDNPDRARVSYLKAQDYYRKIADKNNGDVTNLAWKQAGNTALASLGFVVIAAGAVMVPSTLGTSAGTIAAASSGKGSPKDPANTQSGQAARTSGVKSGQRTQTSIQGYEAYMTKYNQPYVPTYQGINLAFRQPPADSASLSVKKAYANEKARLFEDRSALTGKVLECFDKNPGGGAVLHACVNTVTTTVGATGATKE